MQVFNTVGKRTRQLGTLIEANEKKLVLWISRLKKLDGSLTGLAKLVAHATAAVKDHSD